MLDIVRKHEYFDWLTERVADLNNHTLKGIQDAWILSILRDKADLKMAEIGGGRSRVLEQLSLRNECWNIDKFEGLGAGPTDVPTVPGVKIVRSYMGDFNTDIPDNYFDVVFSISVIEHVPSDNIHSYFDDCFRILKPGGILLHAIDLYIFDEAHSGVRVDLYRQAVEAKEFTWLMSPAIDNSISFQCSFASNSDVTMNVWNQIVPELRGVREQAQSVSIKLMAFKTIDIDLESAKALFDLASRPWSELDQTPPSHSSIPLITNGNEQTGSVPSKPSQEKQEVVSSFAEGPLSPSGSGKKNRKKHHRRTQAAKQANSQMTSTLEIEAISPRSTSQRITELIGRVVAYYSRWPVVIAILAIAFNSAALLLESPWQWISLFSGTILLIFLIGHAASKADRVLEELQKIK